MPTLNFDVLWRDRGAREGIEGLGEASEEAGSKFGDFAKTVGAGALGAGVAAGGLLTKGFTDNLSLETGRAKLQAQLDLSGEESARAGKVAGDLYAGNYGESMDQVNDALKSVMGNIDGMRDASAETLQDISAKVLNLQTTTGETSDAISNSISQMLRTGMADSAEEALDIVTAGFQNGANKSEDFLDTLNEYGTQFRKFGLDGQEATGLISQGLKAGARDGDIVADAIKEFSIRAIDGSESTVEGFEAIGLSAEDMSKKIAKGGPGANKALDQTLDKLRAVKDPAERSAIAVQLFGTQAEDLGDALFALDPSEAAKGLGDVAGAADRMDQTLGDTGQARINGMTRSFEQWTQEMAGSEGAMGGVVAGAIAFGGPGLAMAGSVGQIVAGLAVMNPAMVFAKIQMGLTAAATGLWTGAQWLLNAALTANPIGLVVVAIAALVGGLILAYNKSETFRAIVDGAFRAVGGAAEWLWGKVQDAFGKIQEIWGSMSDTFSRGMDDIKGFVTDAGKALMRLPKKGADMIRGLGNKITDTAGWLWNKITGITEGISNRFRNAGKWLVGAGKNIVRGLWNGWLSMNQWLGGKILDAIEKVKNRYSNAGRWLVSAGKNVVRGLWNGWGSMSGWLAGKIQDAISKIKSKFSNARNWLVSAGKNVLLGLKDGMATAVSAAGQWARDIGNKIIGSIKGFFGIRSPSRLMMGIGGNLMSGLVGGMLQANPAKLVPKIFGSMPRALENLVNRGLVSIKNLPKKAANALMGLGGSIGNRVSDVWNSGTGTVRNLVSFDSGGIAPGVGMLAKNTIEPERVLSPRQTAAFENLVSVLNSAPAGAGAASGPSIDYAAMGAAVVSAFVRAGISVEMDSRTVGSIIGRQAQTLGRA